MMMMMTRGRYGSGLRSLLTMRALRVPPKGSGVGVAVRGIHTAPRTAVDMDPNILAGHSTTTRISRYGAQGFTISGVHHKGPVIVLPNIHLGWKIEATKDITPDALTAVELLHPRPEILVIGTGDRVEEVPRDIRLHLQRLGILLEVQNTRHACATFNFLAEEGRMAAAALFPPANFVKEPIQPKKKRAAAA